MEALSPLAYLASEARDESIRLGRKGGLGDNWGVRVDGGDGSRRASATLLQLQRHGSHASLHLGEALLSSSRGRSSSRRRLRSRELAHVWSARSTGLLELPTGAEEGRGGTAFGGGDPERQSDRGELNASLTGHSTGSLTGHSTGHSTGLLRGESWQLLAVMAVVPLMGEASLVRGFLSWACSFS